MTLRHLSVLVAGIAVLVSGALLSSSCGGGDTVSPPTTLPTTTPTTTLATPPPVGGCPIGPGNPYANCDRGTTSLLPQVESAMDTLIAKSPQLFDLESELA